MTDKQKNLIIRTITGVLFVGCMVSCFLQPRAMVLLFALITGLSIWEYCGLVNNEIEDVCVNRFISTVAGVYFFLAVAGFRTGVTGYNFVVFIPYIFTIVYLFIYGYIQAIRMLLATGLTRCFHRCTSLSHSRSSTYWHLKYQQKTDRYITTCSYR